MKKITLIITFIIMSILLVSCHKDEIKSLENQITQLESELIDSKLLIDAYKTLEAENESYIDELIRDLEMQNTDCQEIVSEDDSIISDYKTRVELLESKIIEIKKANEIEVESVTEANDKKRQILLKYILYDEDYNGINYDLLENMLSKFLEGRNNKILYTEYSHFNIDYYGEDPIHNDSVFSNELEYYRLVTDFENVDEMYNYYKQWYSSEASSEIMNQFVGDLNNRKKYVAYKDKLFTMPGDMGYYLPTYQLETCQLETCKFKVIDKSKDKVVMKVIIPMIHEDYEGDYINIEEYELTFLYEDGDWKFEEKKDII